MAQTTKKITDLTAIGTINDEDMLIIDDGVETCKVTVKEIADYINENPDTEVNVQSDWNETDASSDSYIKNKPTSMTADGGNADTVNNHTVNANVPANAEFTDTIYTHPDSGVTAGTYRSVTVDEQGHVTSGSNPTTLSEYGITDAAYSAATPTTAGLMSASDKSKLDKITESADSVSFTPAVTTGKKVGTLTINGTDTVLYAPNSITSDCSQLYNIKFRNSIIHSAASNYYGIAMGASARMAGQNNFVFGSGLNYGLSGATAHKQFIIGQLNEPISSGDTSTEITDLTSLEKATAFVIGNGYYSTTYNTVNQSNAFRIDYSGNVYGKEFLSGGADYAELLEWKDENVNNEDRVGYFVTFDENYIRFANSGEYIVGVVSGIPSVVGNEADQWQGRFVRDDFGRIVYTEWDETDEATQEVVTKTAPVINPDYDSALIYDNRGNRQEWDKVGMLGIVRVYDDGTCEPNSYCKAADGGIATAATVDEYGYLTPVFRVLRRISENIVEIFFK